MPRRNKRVWLDWLSLVCLFALLLPSCFRGEDLRYLSHQAWSTQDGLPQSSVHAIAQTEDGYIWLATEGGLARFSGFAFRVFDRASDPVLESDDLCCLLAGRDDVLWIGGKRGVLQYRQESLKRLGAAEGLPVGEITGLAWDGQGSVRVSTPAGNVSWRPPAVAAVPRPDPQVAGRAGWHWTPDAVSFKTGGRERRWTAGRDLPSGRIQALAADANGLAWVGMDGGLAVLDPVSGETTAVHALDGNSVLSILHDREGNHWIGTETGGLHLLRRLRFRNEPELAGKSVTSVTQTADGAVWVGTRQEGLQRQQNGIWSRPVPSRSLISPVILTLNPESHGGLWVGTPDGLNLVEAGGAVRQFTSSAGLPDDFIRSLAAAPDGSVWIGTRHGLAHLQGKSVTVLTSADGLGGDLIGTMLLLPTENGRGSDLWVSTSGGLSHIAPNGQVRNVVLDRDPDRDPERIVTALVAETPLTLWVATRDGALWLLKDGHLRPAAKAAHAQSRADVIQSMVADRAGTLWLRMDRGIRSIGFPALHACVAKGGCSLDGELLQSYGRQDGMPSDEMVAGSASAPWLTANGDLLFPARGGLAVTEAAAHPSAPVPPPVLIQDVQVDERSQAFHGAPLQLKFGHERLSIDYISPSYTAPADVRYRFWLEGFDQPWTDAGTHRTATFTNLPPGRYTFHAQASLRGGEWSRDRAQLGFRVIPPFYRRWWFILAVSVAFLALLAGLYLLRLRVLRKQFQAVLAERNRIAREIHDTLTQDFVGTSLQLDLIAHHLRRGKVDSALEQVRATRRLVSTGLDEARQSIWELRANAAEESLPARLNRLVQRESFSAIAPRLRVGGAYHALAPRTERELLRITQEALSNVQRHARANETHVELFYSGQDVLLTVRDDGIGFLLDESAGKEGHFGLLGMRERTSVIGGILEVTTEPGRGSQVSVRVPLTRENTSR